MAGVARYNISEISPNVSNAMVVAIIIGKKKPRNFPPNGAGYTRSVWNFTVRDSPTDTVNIAAWGNPEYISSLADSLRVGDVVEISNPRVIFRQGGQQEELYSPFVSSEFSLILSETHSTLQKHEEAEVVNDMQQLLHLSTKPTTNFLTLADVERKNEGTMREFADLLVAVCKIGELRQITLKSDGSTKLMREVLLLDYTSSGTNLTLWDQDIIERSNMWVPGQTVLFLADAVIEFNNYKRRPSISVGQRTIVTEDPVSDEANVLREFASKAPLMLDDELQRIQANINPATINSVMSVKQLLEQISSDDIQGQQQLTALLYCVLTNLDIDGLQQILSTKCRQCGAVIDERVDMCENCVTNLGCTQPVTSSFNLRVTLSDHTGSINSIRLTGNTACQVLGISVDEFLNMDMDDRTAVKWSLLLERCAVRVLVLRSTSSRPIISIVSCEKCDPMEAASRLPMNS